MGVGICNLSSSFVVRLPMEDEADLIGWQMKHHLNKLSSRPCTFDELWQEFGQNKSLIYDDNQTCWSLDQMIMRIPASAIADRNNLIRLGNGKKGGVYKANILLKHGQSCIVAIKTDHCYDGIFRMLSSWLYPNFVTGARNNYGDNLQSCLATGAVRRPMGASFLAGEYTGALPFYAQTFVLKQKEHLSGLLPTWGVVVQDKDYDTSTRFLFSSYHASLYTRIVAVVMPLQPFAFTLDENHVHERDLVRDLTVFYRGMIEASKGLAFLHEMGLVHQDVKAKNLGVLKPSMSTFRNTTDTSVVLYDNSFLKRDTNFQCPENSLACNYCMEPPFFESGVRTQDLVKNSNSNVESDTIHLKAVIRNTALQNRNELDRARQAARILENVVSDNELIAALQNFVYEYTG